MVFKLHLLQLIYPKQTHIHTHKHTTLTSLSKTHVLKTKSNMFCPNDQIVLKKKRLSIISGNSSDS